MYNIIFYRTVSVHSVSGEFLILESSNVIVHGYPITALLGVVCEAADIVRLTAVAYTYNSIRQTHSDDKYRLERNNVGLTF